jgi:Protein of unknown function (DUF3237)
VTIPLIRLMSISVRVGDPVIVEAGAPGRRFIPILGGEVSGRLSGKVVEGGGDWQTMLPDGTIEISAHYVLDIAGEGLLEVRSEGLRHAPPDVMEALGRSERVDPSSYYFRTTMRLHGSSPAFARFNRMICLARGRREPPLVHLAVFEVG